MKEDCKYDTGGFENRAGCCTAYHRRPGRAAPPPAGHGPDPRHRGHPAQGRADGRPHRGRAARL